MLELNVLYCHPGTFHLSVNVTAEAMSSRVISVKWDFLRACNEVDNDTSVNFTVQYTVDSNGDRRKINETKQLMTIARPDAQLTGLMPYTNYSIEVAAVDEFGVVGPYSYPVIVQTLDDGS